MPVELHGTCKDLPMLRKPVFRRLRGRGTRMQAKLFGHPIHPMLIVFPLGLLATSPAFDIAYLVTGDPSFGLVSFWMITAGIIGGLLAAVFGFMDWLGIPAGTRAKAIGMWHGIGNGVVVLLFVGSW